MSAPRGFRLWYRSARKGTSYHAEQLDFVGRPMFRVTECGREWPGKAYVTHDRDFGWQDRVNAGQLCKACLRSLAKREREREERARRDSCEW